MADPGSPASVATGSAAAQAVAPRIVGDIMWLVPPGERHVDGMAAAELVGQALVSAFLAALMKEVAKQAMDWLVARLKSVFGGSPTPLPDAVAAAAAAAVAAVPQSVDRAQSLAEAETALMATLRTMLPEPEARRMATAVREEVDRHALAGG